jgi:hypothetical protein
MGCPELTAWTHFNFRIASTTRGALSQPPWGEAKWQTNSHQGIDRASAVSSLSTLPSSGSHPHFCQACCGGQIAGTKNAERPGSIQNVVDAPFATQVGQDRAGSLYAPRPKGTTDAYIAMVYEQQGNYEKANEEWGAVSFRAARTAEEKAHSESDTEN